MLALEHGKVRFPDVTGLIELSNLADGCLMVCPVDRDDPVEILAATGGFLQVSVERCAILPDGRVCWTSALVTVHFCSNPVLQAHMPLQGFLSATRLLIEAFRIHVRSTQILLDFANSCRGIVNIVRFGTGRYSEQSRYCDKQRGGFGFQHVFSSWGE